MPRLEPYLEQGERLTETKRIPHRPVDSRLLANLLANEKEHANAVEAQIHTAQKSLNSCAAYVGASASSLPSASHAKVMEIATALVDAHEAFRIYLSAAAEWSGQLEELKKLEDEVEVVARDREILTARVIKVSKRPQSQKSTPATAHSATKEKLKLAQDELRACETYLAKCEANLAQRREDVLVEGLKGRRRALVECGMKWSELGKDPGETKVLPRIPSSPPDPNEIGYNNYVPEPHATSNTSSLSTSRGPVVKSEPHEYVPSEHSSDSSDEYESAAQEHEMKLFAPIANDNKTTYPPPRRAPEVRQEMSQGTPTVSLGSPTSTRRDKMRREPPKDDSSSEDTGRTKSSEWVTRTEKNLRELSKDDSSDDETNYRTPSAPSIDKKASSRKGAVEHPTELPSPPSEQRSSSTLVGRRAQMMTKQVSEPAVTAGDRKSTNYTSPWWSPPFKATAWIRDPGSASRKSPG